MTFVRATLTSRNVRRVTAVLETLWIVIALLGLLLGSANAYQAVTGRRLSKTPSVRSDYEMRRQSTIAASILLPLTLLLVALVIAGI